jgi:CubicO group peptidase (beta-lactamase class C family)
MTQPYALAAIVLLLGFSSAAAQQPLAPSTILRLDGSSLTSTEVDATVIRLMKSANVTGVGIAVFHNGKISYLKTYGQRDTEKGLALTPDTVMPAASISKAWHENAHIQETLASTTGCASPPASCSF